jgi:hypothetical protein
MSSRVRFEHRSVAVQLSAFIDGELNEREASKVERHLAECAVCRRDLDSLRQTVALLRQVPVRPVPRSFALPKSAQATRVAHRRWATAYSFMSVATVAVSFMLVLFLSTDALLKYGAIPIPDTAVVREKAVILSAPAEPKAGALPTEAVEPSATGEALAAVPPTGEAEATPESQPQPAGGGSMGTPGQAVSAEKAAPPPSQDVPTANAEGSRKSVAAPRASGAMPATPTAVAATPTAAALIESERPADALPTTEGASSSPVAENVTAGPNQSPTEAQVLATGAQPTDAAEPVMPYALSPLWRLWRTVRLLSGVLAGLWCALVAGIIWTARKRRV